MEDVRKWAKWQMQGITLAVLGVILIVVGLALATSGPIYEAPVDHPEVQFAICFMMPAGYFMTIAGIGSYYYYRDKVKRCGTQETERD